MPALGSCFNGLAFHRYARVKPRPLGLGRKARPLIRTTMAVKSPPFGVQTRTGCLKFRYSVVGDRPRRKIETDAERTLVECPHLGGQ